MSTDDGEQAVQDYVKAQPFPISRVGNQAIVVLKMLFCYIGNRKKFVEAEHRDKVVEKYVAPLYNYLLSKGGEIYISDVNPKKVHVLGTPKELEEFIRLND